jgi:hypothetical protein
MDLELQLREREAERRKNAGIAHGTMMKQQEKRKRGDSDVKGV